MHNHRTLTEVEQNDRILNDKTNCNQLGRLAYTDVTEMDCEDEMWLEQAHDIRIWFQRY
jgi:hypothetical protein